MADITFSIIAGSKQSAVHEFSNVNSIIVGKSEGCDLILNGRGVSRQHCRFEIGQTGWTVVDLGSTNGLVVNNIKLGGPNGSQQDRSLVLHSGDVLCIGEIQLQVRFDSGEKTELLEPNALEMSHSTELIEPRVPGSNQLGENPQEHRDKVAATFPQKQLSRFAHAGKPDASHVTVALPTNHSALELKDDVLPRDFRQYQLVKKIGEGAMGEVLLAVERNNQEKFCAIKFLKPIAKQTDQDRSRFLREMSISMSLKHPALIQCIECGEEKGQLFIVMEYCQGGNLSQLLQRSGILSDRRAVRLLDRLLDGIGFAHTNGIVHRDLKPSNILLHQNSLKKYVPRVSDFGLAKSYLYAGESGMTVDGTVGGTWGYMPREQLTNFRYVRPQSDVWSIGAIFFETLTLQLPRPMNSGCDPIRTILESNMVPLDFVLPTAHPALIQFINKSLVIDPDARFQDANEMRNALHQVAAHMEISL